LHSTDGTIVYVNRFQEPAYWRKGEIENDIDYYSQKLGQRPTKIVQMPAKKGYVGGAIATWGTVALEPIVDSKILSIIASGKPANIGALVDFVGNYEWSVKNDLPVFLLSGGPGFVWAASHKQNDKGTLRFFAINPSAFYGPVPPPAPPPPSLPSPQADSDFKYSDVGRWTVSYKRVDNLQGCVASSRFRETRFWS
jgi:hypothetical protein